MSRYSETPLSFDGLKTVPIDARGGKIRTEDFAWVYKKGSGVMGWLDSLPKILAGDSFRGLLDAVIEAIERFRGGGPPTPMHPSPAGDDAFLRKRSRKCGDPH